MPPPHQKTFSPPAHPPLSRALPLTHLHCTSRYMACESCPMVLLAVHTYSPASVYWISLRVRDETRAWLRTTMRPSRVWQERNWESGVGLWAALQLRDKHKSTSQQPSSAQHLEAITWQVKPRAQQFLKQLSLVAQDWTEHIKALR